MSDEKWQTWDAGPATDCETCGPSFNTLTVYDEDNEWVFEHTYGCYDGDGGRGDLATLTTYLDGFPTLKQEVLDWAATP